MNALKLNIPNYNLSDEQFSQLCQENDWLRFERSPLGQLLVMEPTGGYTGWRNTKLSTELEIWNRKMNLGIVFDSSTGFSLPNGALYSPDAAWINKDRWATLTEEQKEKFIPLCPDFLFELRSKNDRLADLQIKMQHYLDCGLLLGWLIDPYGKKVYIYNCDEKAIISPFGEILDASPVLPDFRLDLIRLFEME